MASGALLAGGPDDDKQQHRRFASESKVYRRKSFNKSSSKPSSVNPPSSDPPPPQPRAASPAAADGVASSRPVAPCTSDDASSSLNRANPPQPRRYDEDGNENILPVLPPPPVSNGHGPGVVTINLAFRSRHDVRELRRKLAAELAQVRDLSKRLEAHELQLNSAATPTLPAGYTISQLSVTDPNTPIPGKRVSEAVTPGTRLPNTNPFRHQLSVSMATSDANLNEGFEKEKRTPKANQFYRNSDFVLGKEKLPPPEPHVHKKSKANGGKKHSLEWDHGAHPAEKLYSCVFRSCNVLLGKLMKHKHAWVFNKPVDVKGLGLHDYYTIIKYPMDLGTIKSRLSKNWYKSPPEFAEDVRLTFQNAMTYNSEGQDVHFMAKDFLNMFEERWLAIEAELAYALYPPFPKKPPPLDMRMLERSDSTVHPMAVEPVTKSISHPAHISRPPALKKPKAKDLNKRDMTFDEKQKLSNNLQNLPPEKLENIVQIIKKRNTSLSQHDDEIEVDIDSVGVETLWELDRFVTNYKKSLSKIKRKAELAILARQKAEKDAQDMTYDRIEQAVAAEAPVKIPIGEDKKTDNAIRSTSSSSSSSNSGSSSSDSDSESSSGYGSDAVHLPHTLEDPIRQS